MPTEPMNNWKKLFDEKFEQLSEETYNPDWIKKTEDKWVWVDKKSEVKQFIAQVERDAIQRTADELIGNDELDHDEAMSMDLLGNVDIEYTKNIGYRSRNHLRAEQRTKRDQLLEECDDK